MSPVVTESRFEQMAARLAGHPAGGYRYPDPINAMENAAFPLAKRQEEASLLSTIFRDRLPPGRPLPALAWDAGCGLGPHLSLMADTFRYVLAVDADPSRLSVAAAQATGRPGVRLFPVGLHDAVLRDPVCAGAAALVMCMQVVGHLPLASQPEVLQTLHGLLMPKGWLVLGVPYINTDHDEFWVAQLDETGCFASYQSAADEYDALARTPRPGLLPVRHFCLPMVNRMLRKAGFTVTSVTPYNWFTETRADLMILAQA